jgi:membrane-bound lytic murein transglycosylase D
MKMKLFRLNLLGAFFISITSTLFADVVSDTLKILSGQDQTDTLAMTSMPEIGSENDRILAMLDSLVTMKFYTNQSFTADSNRLNVYNYEWGYVPEFPDSVIQQRIDDLNRESIIELALNSHVKSYINTYAVKRRNLTSKVLGLSEVYFPMFEEMLDKYNLPLELKYLAIVESALNPTANSRAGAKGLWQFMYGTGKMYGLKVTSLVDDRFDPLKSTDAACRHLQDLYTIYGDWSLALAAYNSGPGNVNKAIRRAGGVKSYWAIWPYLPRETRGYVPAFIAVMYIMNYPAEYNLYPIDPGILSQQIDTVTVKDVLSFDQISEMMGISIDELKYLNPAFKEGIIPSSDNKQYILRLPHPYVSAYIDKETELYNYKTEKGIEKEKLLAEIKKAEERNIHVVRSGENLGSIAQKYRCSVNNLKSWNNLRSNTIYPGQKLILFAPAVATSNKSSVSSKPTDINALEKGYHQVRAGENLGLIAQKYKCSVEDIKKWNNLNNNTIQPGQKILVYEPKQDEEIATSPAKNNQDVNYVYYTVRQGDTLWDIAKLYDGVSVDQIKTLNNINNSKKLKPGQKLKVAVKS